MRARVECLLFRKRNSINVEIQQANATTRVNEQSRASSLSLSPATCKLLTCQALPTGRPSRELPPEQRVLRVYQAFA